MALKTKIVAISGVAISGAFLALAQVPPVPTPGGDVLDPQDFPPVLIHQSLPSTHPGFDGLNAELNGITNFRGLSALSSTGGTEIEIRAYRVHIT